MTRGGKLNTRDEPERRCIVTGEVQPKAGLLRFVIGPEDRVVPDVAGKLPGRGIWVEASRASIDKAARKGLFSRAAKRPVTADPELSAQVEALLAHRVIGLVSLARKAGEAVMGFEKVKTWLEKDQARALIQAFDGSERGKSKLWPPEGEDTFIGCLSAAELGLAFGREHAIHGALAAGGLAERVVEEAARLAGLRDTGPGGQVGGTAAGRDTKDA